MRVLRAQFDINDLIESGANHRPSRHHTAFDDDDDDDDDNARATSDAEDAAAR